MDTKEHWLIQLDYIAKHPIDGYREYSIPNSGPSGTNVGYADLVNKATSEIFEIKPNNPTGISQGSTEVSNYVLKANIYCPVTGGPLPPPIPWHQGTIYGTTVLPSTDPTKDLLASLALPGVIVYEYIDRSSNPQPYPIAVPSSVLQDYVT